MWDNKVYSAKLPIGLVNEERHHIAHFEMVNIVVCLRVWGNRWKHQKVVIYVDNAAVVSVCNTGYTRDMFLATCIRNIWLLMALYDIQFEVRHIPGYKNKTADLLSRWHKYSNSQERLSDLVHETQWCHVPEWYFTLNNDI